MIKFIFSSTSMSDAQMLNGDAANLKGVFEIIYVLQISAIHWSFQLHRTLLSALLLWMLQITGL